MKLDFHDTFWANIFVAAEITVPEQGVFLGIKVKFKFRLSMVVPFGTCFVCRPVRFDTFLLKALC